MKVLQRQLDVLDATAAELLEQMAEDGEGKEAELADLERRLEQMEVEKAKLTRALETGKRRDQKKWSSGTATRVPVSDPDSILTKNKRGGFAPNHTPVVAVDVESGLIVHSEVLHEAGEASAVGGAIESCRELGRKPKTLLADSSYADGKMLKELAEQEIETLIPVKTLQKAEIALRPDPAQPIADELIEKLPRWGKRFSAACFLYDSTDDCCYCPAGKKMTRVATKKKKQSGVFVYTYRTDECQNCPLAKLCVAKNATRRSITRDSYTPFREASMERLKTEEGKALYKQRAPVVEGVFAGIKHVMGVRQFLTRGHEKVEAEWLWICTAYNLKKLMKIIQSADFFTKNDKLQAVLSLIRAANRRQYSLDAITPAH